MLYSHKKSVNQQKQQQINRSLVIRLLRQQGTCSRAELARSSGLKSATITNIISEFIEKGFVVEDGLMEGCNGRRAIGIRINGDKYRVLGASLTRTHFHVILAGLSGRIYHTRSYPIQRDWKPEMLIAHLCGWMKEMIASGEEFSVLAACLAMPGPYTTEGEMVFITNLLEWDGISLSERLQQEFDIPVVIENDANAGACGEMWFSEGTEQIRNMIYILAGQGIGCGILNRGRILKGDLGLAGEIGHTTICYDGELCECGNRGCLERYCSTLVLTEHIKERLKGGERSLLGMDFTGKELADAVRKGDTVACEEYRRVCEYLAVGIGNVINQLNPGAVVIGDELAEIAPQIMLEIVSKRLQASLRPMIWDRTRISVSRLSCNSTLLGAAAAAAEYVFDHLNDLLSGE